MQVRPPTPYEGTGLFDNEPVRPENGRWEEPVSGARNLLESASDAN